jgi:hypothetical protein
MTPISPMEPTRRRSLNHQNSASLVATTSPDLRSHPAVRNYILLCLTALFLSVVCLAARGLGWWCLAPALVGCLTLLTHWVHGPPLVLLSLAGLLSTTGSRGRWVSADWPRLQTPTLLDVVLCLAMLAYVVGHYRLLSLRRCIFPPDPPRPYRDPLRRRSPDLVTGWETALLGLALPVWTGLALMTWVWMAGEETPLGMPHELRQALRLAWASLAVLAAAGIAASYLRWATATPEESLLYLQDQCWRQTRHEQGSLNRWLAWARLRAQRKGSVPKPNLGTRGQA